MTIRYVGIGGNDANSGLTWALRKATLNGVEDSPVAAGDTVYVGAGTYREQLTCDVSGTAGSPTTYIGDYDGSHTDGVGGVVRITGSDNDITATRTRGITSTSKDYRTFSGFHFDLTTQPNVLADTASNWSVEKCFFGMNNHGGIQFSTSINMAIDNCYFNGGYRGAQQAINIFASTTQDDKNILITNSIFSNNYICITVARTGGVVIKNNLMMAGLRGVNVSVVPNAGQTITATNNIIYGFTGAGLYSASLGFLVEDYNSLFSNAADRTNVAVGEHSNTYPPLFDSKWFFELASRNQKLVSPFDLSSASQLINVAGTSPTTTDLRGQAVIGAQREWGALEYNPALSRAVGMSRGRTI